MRTLSGTLAAAQQRENRRPCLDVNVSNISGGVVRADWQEIYAGTEPEGLHGVAVTADGSLLRVRVTPVADARRLYRQRVAAPGPEADFSHWTNTGYYNVAAVAVAAIGMEVSIVWIESNRQVRRIVSSDGGVTFGSPETIDYTPSTAVNGLAVAYRPGGDLFLFFGSQSTLYVKKRVSGTWQARLAWDKSTGLLSGIAAMYAGDWLLLVAGQDSAGNYKLWSLALGDGGVLPSGAWSALSQVASGPSGGDFQYRQPFIACPDVCRCSFVEVYTGQQPYQRVMVSHMVPGAGWLDNLWREPAPLALPFEQGMALAYDGTLVWASHPSAVLCASLHGEQLNLAADVTGLRLAAGTCGNSLEIELRNDDGRYAFPGADGLSLLSPGNCIEVSLGYRTVAGDETSPVGTYRIERLEHRTGPGVSTLAIEALDAWHLLDEWKAPCQFRWNRSAGELNIRDIARFIAARAGLDLVVLSASAELTDWFPDFTLHPGTGGRAAINRLLAMVPDAAFVEGETVFLYCPQPGDGSVYSYGNGHDIMDARYRHAAPEINRVQVEGWDAAAGRRILVDAIDWPGTAVLPVRRRHIENRNVTAVERAGQLGAAVLRKAALVVSLGCITVPVNCGQQVGDVVDITDTPAGLMSTRRRVSGLTVSYLPRRGEYVQTLELGGV